MPKSNLNRKKWCPSPVLVGGHEIPASHYTCKDYAECIVLHADHWKSIANTGGMLVIKVEETKLIEERIPGVDKVFYKHDGPPIVQIWNFPKLAFPTSLQVAREWGFPADSYASKTPNLWNEVQAILMDLDSAHSLCVERISPDFLILRKLSEPKLELEKLEAVMRLNSSYFGAHLSVAEKKDQLRHWYKQDFFTIGAI